MYIYVHKKSKNKKRDPVYRSIHQASVFVQYHMMKYMTDSISIERDLLMQVEIEYCFCFPALCAADIDGLILAKQNMKVNEFIILSSPSYYISILWISTPSPLSLFSKDSYPLSI